MRHGKVHGSDIGRIVQFGTTKFGMIFSGFKREKIRDNEGDWFNAKFVCLAYKEMGENWVVSENPQPYKIAPLTKDKYWAETTRRMDYGIFLNKLDNADKKNRLPFKEFRRKFTEVYKIALEEEIKNSQKELYLIEKD